MTGTPRDERGAAAAIKLLVAIRDRLTGSDEGGDELLDYGSASTNAVADVQDMLRGSALFGTPLPGSTDDGFNPSIHHESGSALRRLPTDELRAINDAFAAYNLDCAIAAWNEYDGRYVTEMRLWRACWDELAARGAIDENDRP